MGTTRARWPASVDVALAVAFAVVAEVELRTYHQSVLPGRVPLVLDSWLVLLPLVPLAWRRAAPFASCLAMAGAITLVGAGLGGTICFFGGFFPFLASVYTASAWARAPWDRVSLAAPVALMLPMHWYVSDFRIPSDLFFGLFLCTMAWVAGQGVRRWRHQSQQLAAALVAAEAGRDAQAALAVAEERARIARELHDVVAHGMSVMVMQAGAARPAVHDAPDEVATALEHIEDTGRTAMLEMRRLLGILREDDSETRHPQPRLHAVPALIEALGHAGLVVEEHVDGQPRALPDAQDVSAYRIVQETLTNALRHGEGGRAALALHWQDDRLRIEASNPVSPDRTVNGASGGHGLVGIRERVALFDGRFSAGPVGGRFVTVAELPYDGALA